MKKSALATVFLVVVIDLMGFGIVLPLLPFYAGEFQASAVVIGLLYSVYSLMQLIFSPIWGSLSDRIGRRPIMLLSTFGARSEEHTSELQSRGHLVCRLLLEEKNHTHR